MADKTKGGIHAFIKAIRPKLLKLGDAMKKIVLVMTLLLTGCSNFAGINWENELKNTHWASSYTNTEFNAKVSKFGLQKQGYIICNRRLVTITRLNKEGLKIMHTEGCNGCHPQGGILPSLDSVHKYKEETSDPNLKELF